MAPGYIKLAANGELEVRVQELMSKLDECNICPRDCGVKRTKGELGFCKAGMTLSVSGTHPHFGEEAPLVGTGGSGTIFLTGCNLRCIYCQNYEISHLGIGEEISGDELVERMLKLQRIGCHNINFVTPTHFVPQLVEGIYKAEKLGLKIPIVYNCGGYESVETLKLLDGIIDIYMPDMKYGRSKDAEKFSKAKDYPKICFAAVSEMYKQVGDLKIDKAGVAYKGLLVRHLILPGDIAGSERVFGFLAEKISKNTYINIMDQYHPQYNAYKFDALNRPPSSKEYKTAVELANKFGLNRGESYRHESVIGKIFMLKDFKD
jgi:putative pyruvate formate lyase activating enzyme